MKAPRVAAKMSRSTPAPARTSTTTTTPTAAPKLSKDELRAQVAKLEGSNATLKAKSRDMNRMIKAASSRIAELETELAELREQAAAVQVVAKPVKEAKAPRAARTSRKAPIDPGDAVPPGVAVEEPQPLDEEAQMAQDALEEHLSGS
jgi:chromosome segregation ATPase